MNPWQGRRFRLPWRSRAQIGAEVEEEIAFHLDMRVEELIGEGVDPAEARRRASVEFGNVEVARREMRRADSRREDTRRRSDGWDALLRDLRFAGRALRGNPGFTATAVATLALGIGAATAMFSVVNGILLRPLPVAEEDRVVVMWAKHPTADAFMHFPLRYPELRAFEEGSRALAGVAGVEYTGAWPQVLEEGGRSGTVAGTFVTGDLFRVLGARRRFLALIVDLGRRRIHDDTFAPEGIFSSGG